MRGLVPEMARLPDRRRYAVRTAGSAARYVLEQREVVLSQVCDGAAVAVEPAHVDRHERDGASKSSRDRGWLLLCGRAQRGDCHNPTGGHPKAHSHRHTIAGSDLVSRRFDPRVDTTVPVLRRGHLCKKQDLTLCEAASGEGVKQDIQWTDPGVAS